MTFVSCSPQGRVCRAQNELCLLGMVKWSLLPPGRQRHERQISDSVQRAPCISGFSPSFSRPKQIVGDLKEPHTAGPGSRHCTNTESCSSPCGFKHHTHAFISEQKKKKKNHPERASAGFNAGGTIQQRGKSIICRLLLLPLACDDRGLSECHNSNGEVKLQP